MRTPVSIGSRQMIACTVATDGTYKLQLFVPQNLDVKRGKEITVKRGIVERLGMFSFIYIIE